MELEKAVSGILKKRDKILVKAVEEEINKALQDEAILKSIYAMCNNILTGDLEPFKDKINITITYKQGKLLYKVTI